MTQYKDKVAKGETNLTVGLYTYPCLMAADILIYDADYVPVGEDQKQHVELTRDIANRFNNRYGETFRIPEPLVPKVGARIMSSAIRQKKMSKSDKGDKGCIYLLEDLKSARKKIMSAVTDNEACVRFDPENQPGIANLLTIMSSLSGEAIETIVERFAGKGYGEFKSAVADVVCAELEKNSGPLQRDHQFDLDRGNAGRGRRQAQRLASRKLEKVQRKIGLEFRKR